MYLKFKIGDTVAFKDTTDYDTPEHCKPWFVGKVTKIAVESDTEVVYRVNCAPYHFVDKLEKDLKPACILINPSEEEPKGSKAS